MPLLFRYELTPKILVFSCPYIWPFEENVVRKYIVVPERWDDWNQEVVVGIVIIEPILLAPYLDELFHHKLVLRDDLVACAGYMFIIVMACTVPGPYNKVDLVLQVILDPLEGGIDKRVWRVAF